MHAVAWLLDECFVIWKVSLKYINAYFDSITTINHSECDANSVGANNMQSHVHIINRCAHYIINQKEPAVKRTAHTSHKRHKQTNRIDTVHSYPFQFATIGMDPNGLMWFWDGWYLSVSIPVIMTYIYSSLPIVTFVLPLSLSHTNRWLCRIFQADGTFGCLVARCSVFTICSFRMIYGLVDFVVVAFYFFFLQIFFPNEQEKLL